jgi:hypothetical protein
MNLHLVQSLYRSKKLFDNYTHPYVGAQLVGRERQAFYRIPTASVTENDGSVAAHDAAIQNQRTRCTYVKRHTQDGDAVRERRSLARRQLVSLANIHTVYYSCVAHLEYVEVSTTQCQRVS